MTTEPRRAAPAGLAVIAVGLLVTAALRAGYDARGQAVFVALAGLAACAAALADERAAVGLLRSAAVAALGLLGVLAALSAAWTIDSPGLAVRWGLVIAGYAAFAVAGGVAARSERGLVVLMALIAALAVGEGMIGLVGVAARELPVAERIGGSWRPGGTLEYTPALALLQVSALALLAAASARPRAVQALPAALGLAVAGAVLAISVSRTETAVALVLVALALARPHRLSMRRADVVAGLVLMTLTGLVTRLLVGGYVAPHAQGGATGRVAAALLTLAAATGLWLPLRALVRRVAPRVPVRLAARGVGVLAVLGLLVSGAIFAGATQPQSGRGVERSAGFFHGRVQQWETALRTVGDRPLQGSGAQAYAVASLPHVDRGNFARFPHQLNLELWAELGLGGLVLSLVLYGGALRSAWRARDAAWAWLAIPAVAAFLASNLLDWPWHLPLAGAVFSLALGATAARARAG